MIKPSILHIEVVRGCNARCIMCPLSKKHYDVSIMSFELFKKIVDKVKYLNEYIKFVNLWYLGEPLLDKDIYLKVEYLKKNGFQGVGIDTNGQFLTCKRSKELINNGVDSLIISIDGVKKETHEKIRRQTDFYTIIFNVLGAIYIRNELKAKTKFIIKMVRQSLNNDEWPEYVKIWRKFLDPNDKIIGHPIHNWIKTYSINKEKVNYTIPCDELFKRMFILNNGDFHFCCTVAPGDIQLGNVLDQDPLEVFNNGTYNYYRSMNLKGQRDKCRFCVDCHVPDVLRNELAI